MGVPFKRIVALITLGVFCTKLGFFRTGRAISAGVGCNHPISLRVAEPVKAFQDYYPENLSHCYGCGSQNQHGHRIRTFWEGDETVTRYTPEAYHTAVPGFVYGGLLASLIDCHGTGTAAAATYRAEGREMGSEPPLRFVTGALNVSYLKPTPLGPELEIRGRVKEIKGRKVVVEATVYAEGVATARGEVIALQMPENFGV